MTELPDLSVLTTMQAKFTEGVLSGQGDVEAYKAAGYGLKSSANVLAIEAHKLKKHPKISLILTNFRLRAAEKIDMSLETHLKELSELSCKANGLDQMGAAIRATELKGKASGLYVELVRHERADPVQDALGVMIEEIERTLGPDAADEYARKKGVERLPSTVTEALPGEYTEVKDEGS